METTNILLYTSILLSVFNLYSFLFQRTVRKIKFMTQHDGLELVIGKFYPDWVKVLYLLGRLRYVSLFLLAFYNWKYVVIILGVFFFLSMVIPVNDPGHIKIMKRFFENKKANGTFLKEDMAYLLYIDKAEQKTLS